MFSRSAKYFEQFKPDIARANELAPFSFIASQLLCEIATQRPTSSLSASNEPCAVRSQPAAPMNGE